MRLLKSLDLGNGSFYFVILVFDDLEFRFLKCSVSGERDE